MINDLEQILWEKLGIDDLDGVRAAGGITSGLKQPKSKTPLESLPEAVTHVAQGDSQSCVLASGQPYCSGQNYDEALGNDFDPNETAWSPTAVQTAGTVLEGKTIVGLTAGGGVTIVTYEP